MPKRGRPKPKVPVEVTRPSPMPTIYSNQTGITITRWDFLFRFGKIIEAAEKKVKVEEILHVYMSPQHAKAFLALVGRQVKLYEEKYGVILEPKQATENTGKKSRPNS